MKKIEQKILGDVQKALESHKEIVVKAVEDNGTFKVVASTQCKDRHGEVVLQAGINTDNYMLNPIILMSHDYWALPIGKATSVTKENNQMIIEGVFASAEANPVAQNVRKLYEAGILKTVSIGFIAKQWQDNIITESELLELSFVTVPANPEALALAKSKGVEKEFVEYTEKAKEKKLPTNQDVCDKMDANHGEIMGKMEEMCKKSMDEQTGEKIVKELVGIVKEMHIGLTKALSDLDSEVKNLSSQVVVLAEKSVVGTTKELDELTADSARISAKIREVIKKGSLK